MDILFTIKKLVSAFISPLPIVTVLLVYGCLLLHKSRVDKKLKRVFFAATSILILSSSSLVANQFLKPLEEYYPVYKDDLSQVDNIVILGCYNRHDEERPFLDNIHDCSTSRIVEAIRLSYVYPSANIITSGGRAIDGEEPHAEVVKHALILMGIKGSRILAVNGSKDTNEESLHLKPLLMNKTNLLLSEATHLKRAVTLFENQGIEVRPVPCRYMTSSKFELSLHNVLPGEHAIKVTDRLLYEFFGNVWVWIKS